MIAEAEIRRLAARWQVDPMILDLDYALGWFLAGLSNNPNASNALRFKGGTCLRKCYFPGYRFSEDLDFTAIRPIPPEELNDWVAQIAAWSADRAGPDFLAAPFRLEVVEDEYGEESFQVRAYYRGPLRWGGSPRSIRLDITRDERLLWAKEERFLLHAYSDADELRGFSLSCYALLEILSEKVRAVCGQRRFAISRDIYDIYRLIQSGVEITDVVPHLAEKFQVRGAIIGSLSVSALEIRRQEYEQSWVKQLDYLIPDSDQITFEDAWQTTIEAIQKVEARLKTE
jgi:predicted nucleotidyltransferase component of viral defense system